MPQLRRKRVTVVSERVYKRIRLSIPRIPLYTYMKLGFVVYLEMQGSQVVYDTLIKEVLQRHETEIEVGLRKLKGGVYDLAVKYLKVIYGSLTSQGQQEEFIPLETEQTEHTQNTNLSQFISSYTPAVISTQLNSQLKRRGRGDDPATQPVQPAQTAQTAQRKATKPPTNSQPEQSSSASSWLFGYL